MNMQNSIFEYVNLPAYNPAGVFRAHNDFTLSLQSHTQSDDTHFIHTVKLYNWFSWEAESRYSVNEPEISQILCTLPAREKFVANCNSAEFLAKPAANVKK